MIIMFVTLSYYDQNKRKQLRIPYYELQGVAQKIYEKDKNNVDFDFHTLEQKYTYFKPYLDYILLQKQGRLDGFLINPHSIIYGNQEGTLSYYSDLNERLHIKNKIIPYLCSDDASIMLNQGNDGYSSILLTDATTLSHENAKNHDLIIELYLHHILSQNKVIALHYQGWLNKGDCIDPYGMNGTYVALYLGVIRCMKFKEDSVVYHTKNTKIQTVAQTNWLNSHETDICGYFSMDKEEAEKAKQFIKSFS